MHGVGWSTWSAQGINGQRRPSRLRASCAEARRASGRCLPPTPSPAHPHAHTFLLPMIVQFTTCVQIQYDTLPLTSTAAHPTPSHNPYLYAVTHLLHTQTMRTLCSYVHYTSHLYVMVPRQIAPPHGSYIRPHARSHALTLAAHEARRPTPPRCTSSKLESPDATLQARLGLLV